ncbi:MAG: hypothetical protein JSS71_08600 [Armatimonadetes bacterium]|nr:hypothetical protein [Armatimonadota bacterium]MBX3109677.1 hypothetical protein [Fimbriimonadaceae bacterium]
MAATNKRMWIYGAVVVIGVAGFMMTEPEKKPSAGGVAIRKGAGTPTTTKSSKVSAFTEEDLEASFARLDEPVKNVFRPGVIDPSKSRGGGAEIPNQIPADFMGGENGWLLTGIVTFDGRTVALLENPSQNEGQYLGVGETLKSATVMGITRNSVTLAGPNGSKEFTILENRPIVDEKGVNANNQPFDPLVGNIGISNASAEQRPPTNSRSGATNEPTN